MTEADDMKKGRKMRPYPRFDADDRNYPFSERATLFDISYPGISVRACSARHGAAVFVQVPPVI